MLKIQSMHLTKYWICNAIINRSNYHEKLSAMNWAQNYMLK